LVIVLKTTNTKLIDGVSLTGNNQTNLCMPVASVELMATYCDHETLNRSSRPGVWNIEKWIVSLIVVIGRKSIRDFVVKNVSLGTPLGPMHPTDVPLGSIYLGLFG